MYDPVVMFPVLSSLLRPIRNPSKPLPRMFIGSQALILLAASMAHAAPAKTDTAHKPIRVALDTIEQRGDTYVAALEGGGIAELTLDPVIQTEAERVLETNKVPFGAAVVISIADGKVLALAARSSVSPKLTVKDLALRPWAPAASVFKLVSAAALVEEAGLKSESTVCYHDGVSSVLPDNLKNIPRLDTKCDSLGYAIGKSQNAIIAKMASKHLDPEALAKTARSFAFGERVPFDAPVEASSFEAPTDPLEFARAAAGFWHSSLSVMHGALIAAAFGNGGLMPAPRLVARAVDGRGVAITLPKRLVRRVMDAATAKEVGRMMEMTTKTGTAKGAFRDGQGKALLPISVAGKTGTLNYRGDEGDPKLPAGWPAAAPLGYSWFVGYAPADKPKLAFAVLLGNQAAWRIKAPVVAERMVAEHLAATGVLPKSSRVAAASPASGETKATR